MLKDPATEDIEIKGIYHVFDMWAVLYHLQYIKKELS